jgi:hypothetical protein
MWIASYQFDLTLGSSSHRVVHRGERCSALSFQAAFFGPAPRIRTGIKPEGRVELVHRFPGPFPSLSIEIAPKGRLPDGFGQQLCNHDSCLRVAEAVSPKPFAQAHGQGDHFPGVIGRLCEPCRGSIRVERVIVEVVRVHEDEDVFGGDLVAPHLLGCSCGVACDGLAHVAPGRDRSPEASGDGNSLPGRLHQLQRHTGDPTQLIDGAATRDGHQRPSIVWIEWDEIAGRCLCDFLSV